MADLDFNDEDVPVVTPDPTVGLPNQINFNDQESPVVTSPTAALMAQIYGPRKDLNSAGPFPAIPNAAHPSFLSALDNSLSLTHPYNPNGPTLSQATGFQGPLSQGKPVVPPAPGGGGSFLDMMMKRGAVNPEMPASLTGVQGGELEGTARQDPNGLAKDVEKARTIASSGKTAVSKSKTVKKGGDKEDSDKPVTLDMGKGKELGTVENLRNVQRGINDATMVNRMGQAFNQIGAGILRVQPSKEADKLYDENIADAQKGNQQFKDLVAQQNTDPNSNISQAFRDYAKQFGVNIQGDFSAADGEKLLPYMFKAFEAKEQREARSQDLEYKMDSLAETRRQHDRMTGLMRQQNQRLQQQKQEYKYEDDYEKEQNQLKSKRGELGDPLAKTRMADTLDSMVKSYKSLNDVPPELYREFLATYSNMVTGGQATDLKFRELLAKTGVDSAAKFFEYLRNNPVAAEQGGFISMFQNSAHHQASQAQAQIDDETIKHLKSYDGNRFGPETVQRKLALENITPQQYKQWSPGGMQARARMSTADQQHLDEFLARNPDVNMNQAIKALRNEGYIQ